MKTKQNKTATQKKQTTLWPGSRRQGGNPAFHYKSKAQYKLTLPKKESVETNSREAAEFVKILYTTPVQVQVSTTSPRLHYNSLS